MHANVLERAARFIPFLQWLPRTTRQSLRADALAGVVGALIVLPQGVAFATLAGMPPEYGLYAAMVPAVVAALFGSSFHLVSGPTNAMSIFLFAQLAPIAEPGSAQYVQLALTVTLFTGVIQLALGIAGLGALVNFVSHSVIVGFTSAAGLLIIASQLRNFFGLSLPRGGTFFETLANFGSEVFAGHVNLATTLVAVFTLGAAIASRRWMPRVPYMIVAVVAGSLFGAAMRWLAPASLGPIPTLGALPGALPPLSAPDLSLETLRVVAPLALGMTILGLTEALSIARAIGVKSGQRIDGTQEFIGQGLSNVAGAFFSAYPSSGSFNRSGANYEAGARTPLATVFASGLLVVALLGVAPLAAHLPYAVMAAVLFLVGYGLIDLHHARQIARTSRREAGVMLGTFLAALLVDLEFSILAGVLVSFVVYLQRTSRPTILDVKPATAEGQYHFSADTGLPDCPQLKMVRVNGSIFFGAVDHVSRALADIDRFNPGQKHLLILASGINFIDVAGAEMLVQEARRRRAIGGGLYFYRMKDEVRRLLERGGYMTEFGTGTIASSGENVIGAIYSRLDPAICSRCTVRIFRNCHARLPNGEPRLDPAAAADSG